MTSRFPSDVLRPRNPYEHECVTDNDPHPILPCACPTHDPRERNISRFWRPTEGVFYCEPCHRKTRYQP